MAVTLDGVIFQESDWLGRGHITTITVGGTSYQRWEGMWVAGINEIDTKVGQVGGLGVAMAYAAETGSTADAAPGNGLLTWNNATQASATVIYLDADDANGTDITALIDTLDDSTSTIKGTLRLTQRSDNTNWILYNLTAVTSASGYRKLTVSAVDYSATSPFADGAALTLSFSRTGDKGETGNIGDITAQTTATTAAMGDWVVIHSLAAGATRKMTLANLLGSTAITSMTVTTLTATTLTATTATVTGAADLRGTLTTHVAGQSALAVDETATGSMDLEISSAQIQYLKLTGDLTVNVFGGNPDANGFYMPNGWILDLEQDSTGLRDVTIQKGNRLTYSADLRSTAEAGGTRPWTDSLTSLSLNAATGPDGRLVMQKLIADVTSGQHDRRRSVTGLAPNQTLTLSVEAQDAGDGLNIRMFMFDTATSTKSITWYVNPATGATVSGPTAGVQGGSPTGTVTALANGNYRFDLTGTVSDSGSDTTVVIGLASSGNPTFAGTGSNGVYVGNVQVAPGQPKGMIEVGASRDIDDWAGTTPAFSSQAAGTKSRVEITPPAYDGYLEAAFRQRS